MKKLIVFSMKLTGFRFDKSYRHAEKGIKRFIYSSLNCVEMNLKANGGDSI